MKFPYFRKMQRWPSLVKRKTRKSAGATTLVSVFLFMIFSTLGLSMLYFTGIYLRISAYKKNSTLQDYASENGIKQGLNQLLGSLTQNSSLIFLSPEELSELWADTQSQGIETVEKLIGQKLPLQAGQDWENLEWKSTTNFSFGQIEENEDYFKAVYRASILSEGKIRNFKHTREATLEASLGVFAGHIPLLFLPILIDKESESGEEEPFFEKNKITLTPSRKNLIPEQIIHSEGDLLPKDAHAQLEKALKIKFFSPFDLSNRILRVALGLEESNEPIPEGVYLIKDDMGLGGIYVQGDLEEMVLAIEEGFQVVSFLKEEDCWMLKYCPQKSRTIFVTPEETQSFDLSPRGIIIVNGKIESLGGGIIDSTGRAVLVTEEEIPSILRGINLTIISSDRITLSSHLIHQGVKWMDDVPYAKDSSSQLNIFATGQDILGNAESEGKIVIDENSPDELKIQASLTASGEGFSIEGEKKSVHILGSLQVSDYSSHDNALHLTFDERLLELEELTQDAPLTEKPVLFLSFFKPLEWREF